MAPADANGSISIDWPTNSSWLKPQTVDSRANKNTMFTFILVYNGESYCRGTEPFIAD
jgi:hypothetical protein